MLNKKDLVPRKWTIIDDSGQDWTVTFSVQFVPLNSDKEVEEALKNDPAGNKLIFDENLKVCQGEWSQGSRTIALRSKTVEVGRYRGGTLIHELGHPWGLPHENGNPEKSLFMEMLQMGKYSRM